MRITTNNVADIDKHIQITMTAVECFYRFCIKNNRSLWSLSSRKKSLKYLIVNYSYAGGTAPRKKLFRRKTNKKFLFFFFQSEFKRHINGRVFANHKTLFSIIIIIIKINKNPNWNSLEIVVYSCIRITLYTPIILSRVYYYNKNIL